MPFESGMELKVKGVPKSNPIRFTIDLGHSEDVIALHFDFRFNYFGEERTIVLNSFEYGSWKEEQRERNFPFVAGQEFEVRPVWWKFYLHPLAMNISFTNDYFYIHLHNGKMIIFPNRLGDNNYKYLSMCGDVMVNSIQVK